VIQEIDFLIGSRIEFLFSSSLLDKRGFFASKDLTNMVSFDLNCHLSIFGTTTYPKLIRDVHFVGTKTSNAYIRSNKQPPQLQMFIFHIC